MTKTSDSFDAYNATHLCQVDLTEPCVIESVMLPVAGFIEMPFNISAFIQKYTYLWYLCILLVKINNAIFGDMQE